MKNILYIFLVGLLFASCEPADMEIPELGSLPTGDFTITKTGDFEYTFKASSDGFMYNWDLGNGTITDQTIDGTNVVGYFPFKGEYSISCTVSGKAGTTKIVKKVTLDAADPELIVKPNIQELTATGAGQTWVYADDYPYGDSEGYCAMVASYDWDEAWWNPYAGEDGPSPDFDGELIFDLNGGFNFTGVDGNQGSFTLGDDDGQLTIKFVGAKILDWDEANCNPDMTKTGSYNIHTLTDDELVLTQHQYDDDYDWKWRFKRKGYTYPAGK